MKAEAAGAPIGKVGVETVLYTGKREFVPRDVGFGKEFGLETFRPGREVGIEQLPPVEEVNLADFRNVDQGKQVVDLDARAGFFMGFAQSGLCCRFTVFHEARRQCPEPVAWFDRTAAKQNIALPLGEAADDKLWIKVVNDFAARTDMAWQVVTVRDAKLDR